MPVACFFSVYAGRVGFDRAHRPDALRRRSAGTVAGAAGGRQLVAARADAAPLEQIAGEEPRMGLEQRGGDLSHQLVLRFVGRAAGGHDVRQLQLPRPVAAVR